jgi:hypothetical protein
VLISLDALYILNTITALDDIGNAEGMGESSVAVDDRPLSFADQLRQEKVLEMAKKSRRLYVALERERSKSKILLRRVQVCVCRVGLHKF